MRQFFLWVGKICDWSTRECHKLRPMSTAVYLLQRKVTQMLRNVSSGERGEQTKYIGECFQENVCNTNIKSTTSSAKIAKQSAQNFKVGAKC